MITARRVMSFTAWFINLNAIPSPIGRGWVCPGTAGVVYGGQWAGLDRDGDGSGTMFVPLGGGAYHNETNVDFSLLTSTGSGGSTVYTRTYPDSSRVQFNTWGKCCGRSVRVRTP